ncbi:hypothetical protein M731_02630 [Neisseria gonorrhoeae ATL_2011_01-25]|uniref:PilS cassette n=1 Tax=Neisseria gonorrhoeae 3502 TaxID=1193404 RepID=A0AA44UAS7_NEIGO|nr:hypothetical protein BZG33_13030 [Neisseria gonorrhoeae]KLS21488.1 hypothetical protein M731_02630 [Neisseria gonorrhoeae ATL_2011_01-25]KLS25506.1 hypothetical protein M737_01100 [Neisseria gonorrhoeae MIA_2011_05-10]KLS40010.1 hypothetical protein M689_01620 [Neisseria gonorrhoeae SK23020]PHJ36399.1 hypothetical protein N776_09465 [Neisseria gonorrhoeae 3502]
MEVTRNLKQAKPNGLDSRLRGNDEFQVSVFRFLFLVFCFRGNNGILSFRNLSEKQKSPRRHSRESGNLEF